MSNFLNLNRKEEILAIPRQELNRNLILIKEDLEKIIKNDVENEKYIYRIFETREFIKKLQPLRVNKPWIEDYINKIVNNYFYSF